MRQLTRTDVIQALATLGVRISGSVAREHFEEAKTHALASLKALQLSEHPDKHGGLTAAEDRFKCIGAAAHLLEELSWFHVAGLFGTQVSRGTTARDWDRWSPAAPATRPGVRYYARCPVCGVLVGAGERHSCRPDVDHFNTRSRPFTYERPWKGQPQTHPPPQCGNESPLGARCTEPPGHTGWHRGYGGQGRHTWHEVRPNFTEETVSVGAGE